MKDEGGPGPQARMSWDLSTGAGFRVLQLSRHPGTHPGFQSTPMDATGPISAISVHLRLKQFFLRVLRVGS